MDRLSMFHDLIFYSCGVEQYGMSAHAENDEGRLFRASSWYVQRITPRPSPVTVV